MKPNLKSKFKIKTSVIIIAVVLIAITVPIRAYADIFSFLGIDSAAKSLLTLIGSAIAYVMKFLLQAAAAFFEGMLGVGFKGALDTIQTGWKACRDFTNMLFILFMIVVAFGTILRTERYGVKKLLPKVIGAALLINFSLVLCSIIIDFSNITANFFIKDIRGKLYDKNTNLEKGAITATFADALALTKTEIIYTDCDAFKEDMRLECEKLSNNIFKLAFDSQSTKAACLKVMEIKYQECLKKGQLEIKQDLSVLDLFLSYTMSSIILLIAAFTLFAGGLMLLFRVIAIWFLVTISPLAFVCLVLPGLQSNWQKWWRTFLNWCIFAPAYAFFVWMAIQIAISGAGERMGVEAGEYAFLGPQGKLSNPITSDPGSYLIKYFVIIGFLVGGLIVAKSLGIYGADTVMNIAQKARKGATDWAKRKTTGAPSRIGAATGGTILQKIGTGLKKTKLFSGLGERTKYAGDRIKGLPFASKDMQSYKKFIESLTTEERERRYKTTVDPHKRALIAMVAAEKDDKNKTDPTTNKPKMSTETALSMHNALKGYNMIKLADELKEARLDVADALGEFTKVVQKLENQRRLGDIAAASLNDTIVSKLVKTLDPNNMLDEIEIIGSKSKLHETMLKVSLGNITNDASDEQTQFAYAAQTGDDTRLLTSTTTNLGKFLQAAAPTHTKRFNRTTATPAQLAQIRAIYAANIPISALEDTIKNIADKTFRSEIVNEIKTSPLVPKAYKDAVTRSRYLNSLA